MNYVVVEVDPFCVVLHLMRKYSICMFMPDSDAIIAICFII